MNLEEIHPYCYKVGHFTRYHTAKEAKFIYEVSLQGKHNFASDILIFVKEFLRRNAGYES